MRLIESRSHAQIDLREFPHQSPPLYAILSHTWGDGEVTFKDMSDNPQKKPGYQKILFCREQAARDGLQYFWVDTCCIDKSSSVELQTSLNYMFRWYRCAAKCYAYLTDVSTGDLKDVDMQSNASLQSTFRNSRWFTRGWTLQELIAPTTVEFFSKEGIRLGDRVSLEKLIHDATGIPTNALRGDTLASFSVTERISWVRKRNTSVEEDKAYSLFGIFDVQMPLLYGEGEDKAFKRLHEEIEKASRDESSKDGRYLTALRSTDPTDDKERIEKAKGGLLVDSYNWILNNDSFMSWRNDPDSRFLWIKGDPGKGKTMLLCGIINELNAKISSGQDYRVLSYFFCQATDARINYAISVLRGLLYKVLQQQPGLLDHVREKYDRSGDQLFQDTNAWQAVSKIFDAILRDSRLPATYFVIDALDECTTDLDQLLEFIVKASAECPHAKWIVSSRNWPSIEEQFSFSSQKFTLSLEINEGSVAAAVSKYIQYKVDDLATRKKYDSKTRDDVHAHLLSNSSGTFLWVSLVSQELAKVSTWKVRQKLKTFPPGLDALYRRMMEQVYTYDDAELCKRILAVTCTVYRPLTLDELPSIIDMPDGVSDDFKALTEIIGLCGSILTLRGSTISFVHQSAKDFLLKEARNELFPSNIDSVHYSIFYRSLQVILSTLRRDIYNLSHPGVLIHEIRKPDPDPLAAAAYSCIYWVDHLHECSTTRSIAQEFGEGSMVGQFMRTRYLFWLEALALLRSSSDGLNAMRKLESLFKGENTPLAKLTWDAYRFVQSFRTCIEIAPLQAYVSALAFSPSGSLILAFFRSEEPRWLTAEPIKDSDWGACLQTFECDYYVLGRHFLMWLPNSGRIAALFSEDAIKIWDLRTSCSLELTSHSGSIRSAVMSPDGISIAAAVDDGKIVLWNTVTGQCHALKSCDKMFASSLAWSPNGLLLASVARGYAPAIYNVATGQYTICADSVSASESLGWSPDNSHFVSASFDNAIKIWDAATGLCTATLPHEVLVLSLAWSPDGTHIASASLDAAVRIWDLTTGSNFILEECAYDGLLKWNVDGKRIATESTDNTVKIWDLDNKHHITLKGHKESVSYLLWSPNNQHIATASGDCTIKIWDATTGLCSNTFKGHNRGVTSLAWSSDSKYIASAAGDHTVKIWDLALGSHDGGLSDDHSGKILHTAWSPNRMHIASSSTDKTIKIWDVATATCSSTLKVHQDVSEIAWSPDSLYIAASVFERGTITVWNITTSSCITTFEDHNYYTHPPASWSPDGARIVARISHTSSKVWDPATSNSDNILECLHDKIESLAWSPDSMNIAFGCSDSTIKILDATTGYCSMILKRHTILEGLTFVADSLAWSPDNTRIASASDDVLEIWDTTTGNCIATVEIGGIQSLHFDTPDLLQTNLGIFDLRTIGTGTGLVDPSSDSPLPPRTLGYGFHATEPWITYQGKRILWLPPDLRTNERLVWKSTMVFGCGTGRVIFLKFSDDGPPGSFHP